MQDTSPLGSAALGLAHRTRPTLLVLHHGDPRLAALEHVLGDLGYHGDVAATPEEATSALGRAPTPDVLLTASSAGSARRGIGFARDCLGRFPALRALYVSFIPRQVPDLLAGRERVLAAPFNAEQLAAALGALWHERRDMS